MRTGTDVAWMKLKYVCFLGLGAGIALAARFPHGSLLGFLGAVLIFDALAALLVLFVRSLRRPSGSSRRTIAKRAGAGVAVALIALFVVQRLHAPSDETRIERTIATVATSSNPAYCDRLVTTGYLEQTTGVKPPFSDDFCRSDAEARRARSTEVFATHVDGDRAIAEVGFEGGSYDGSSVKLRLAREDGLWKLDRIVSFVHFDRDRFDRAYRTRLQEFGMPQQGVECVLSKVRRLSDAEIERATLEGSHRLFAPIAVECDRDGIERDLIAWAANRKYGLPPKDVECTARKVETTGNAGLARLQLDLLAYNELILACDGNALLRFERRELPERGLGPEAVECVLSTLRRLSRAGQIRLIYDEPRLEALVQGCK